MICPPGADYAEESAGRPPGREPAALLARRRGSTLNGAIASSDTDGIWTEAVLSVHPVRGVRRVPRRCTRGGATSAIGAGGDPGLATETLPRQNL